MKTKKTYIILSLILPLFLAWCSIDSLIPSQETKDKISWQIENIQDKVDEAWDKIEEKIGEAKEQAEKIKTRAYQNKKEKFNINFLEGREFQEEKYWFSTIVYAPDNNDGIKENVWISVQQLQKYLSVKEYYEETIANLKGKFKDFKEIDNKDITKDWLKWKTITYTYTQWDKEIKTQETFLMSEENKVYIINYTAIKKTFDKFLAWANEIIASFEITK